MNSQTIEQRLALLEARYNQIENNLKALESKRQVCKGSLSPVIIDELLSRHIMKSGPGADFVCATEVVDFLKKAEKRKIGYKSVAQSIHRLTGQTPGFKKIKGSVKRGYYLSLE